MISVNPVSPSRWTQTIPLEANGRIRVSFGCTMMLWFDAVELLARKFHMSLTCNIITRIWQRVIQQSRSPPCIVIKMDANHPSKAKWWIKVLLWWTMLLCCDAALLDLVQFHASLTCLITTTIWQRRVIKWHWSTPFHHQDQGVALMHYAVVLWWCTTTLAKSCIIDMLHHHCNRAECFQLLLVLPWRWWRWSWIILLHANERIRVLVGFTMLL